MVNELAGVVGSVGTGHLFNVLEFKFDVSDVPVVEGSAGDVDKVGSEERKATLREDTIGANIAPFEISKLPGYNTLHSCCAVFMAGKINIPLATLISCHRAYRIAIETIEVLRAALIFRVLVVLLAYQIINAAPLCRPWLLLLVLSTKDGPSNTCSAACSNAVSALRGPNCVLLRQLLCLVVSGRFSSALRWSFVCILIVAHVISVEKWLNSLAPGRFIRIIG